MLTAIDVERMTQKYFEDHKLHLEGVFPIKERNSKNETERVMQMFVWGTQGRFFMKMYEGGKLYCQSKSGKKWIKIENY